ncbi:segregation and condensation protein A [Sphingomonas endophytica]|uniref:Segregation and condensation protein A n=1 Tax=Sphingomonas endophytica TaxID=869719 RepID=A0A147I8R8_9SPHN|nr:ScpA family protein [Sphingomonas endophytica]KTT75711.1 chromosome segregation protein ScpA [Sphingomonas endophytica]
MSEPPEQLTLALDGWEGPLDLLLSLARAQKVDLREISILQLVEQYLDYVEQARRLRLELAADYLVMAAWLAYLKSALLLPRATQEVGDTDPDELALRLQLRLERLDAMRDAGARLMARDRVGRDVFRRGAPEGLQVVRRSFWDVEYYDLLAAYGRVSARSRPVLHVVREREVMTLEAALARVAGLVGSAIDWRDIQAFLPDVTSAALRRSALASSFLAALELARQGRVELHQERSFAPLYLRRPATG